MVDIGALAAAYNTDKGAWPGYLEIYDRYVGPLRESAEPTALFELGVKHGGSLQLWRDYLPSGPIVGLDLELPTIDVGAVP